MYVKVANRQGGTWYAADAVSPLVWKTLELRLASRMREIAEQGPAELSSYMASALMTLLRESVYIFERHDDDHINTMLGFAAAMLEEGDSDLFWIYEEPR